MESGEIGKTEKSLDTSVEFRMNSSLTKFSLDNPEAKSILESEKQRLLPIQKAKQSRLDKKSKEGAAEVQKLTLELTGLEKELTNLEDELALADKNKAIQYGLKHKDIIA